MNKRSFYYLIGLGAMVLVVGLACAALSSTPTTVPVSNPPTQASVSTSTSSDNGSTSVPSSGDLTTFTDKNKYYQIDLPSDWKHTSGTDTNLYWDRFTSPDTHAIIENVAYDDGTVWTGSQNGRAALLLLNRTYSYTKKEGDIRVSNDSIQKDGSERLAWTSKGGGYSGVSFFEVRNRTTFLMFTVFWDNDYQSTYVDSLDKVITSYRLP